MIILVREATKVKTPQDFPKTPQDTEITSSLHSCDDWLGTVAYTYLLFLGRSNRNAETGGIQ
jgi:hypothetical protein